MDDLNLVVIRMWAAAAWADGEIACKLAAIDGHIADEERVFLKRLAVVVEIDEATAASVQKSAGL